MLFRSLILSLQSNTISATTYTPPTHTPSYSLTMTMVMLLPCGLDRDWLSEYPEGCHGCVNSSPLAMSHIRSKPSSGKDGRSRSIKGGVFTITGYWTLSLSLSVSLCLCLSLSLSLSLSLFLSLSFSVSLCLSLSLSLSLHLQGQLLRST